MMRAMIVDDEVHARRSLEALLAATEEFEIVALCANAMEALQALEAIAAEPPDVLFLDVQLPRVNGFQLLGMISRERRPRVVFVTAFDAFAMRAFEEAKAVDYLLKPVSRERLGLTVERLKRHLSQGADSVESALFSPEL